MQLIVLVPLTSVDIPANVQLLYYFINDNLNFQIIPIDLNRYGIFEFDASEDQGYTPQFADQGYTSLYLLQNVNENFMNLVLVIFLIALVRILELFALHRG